MPKSPLVAALIFLAVNAHSGEGIIIYPTEKSPSSTSKNAKKIAPAVLTGTIQIVPMNGATVVLKTDKFGQVVLAAAMDLEAVDRKRVEDLESSGSKIKVAGTMALFCSEKEFKSGTLGCFRMDPVAVVTLERQ